MQLGSSHALKEQIFVKNETFVAATLVDQFRKEYAKEPFSVSARDLKLIADAM